MDFVDQLKQFSKKVETIKDNLLTEEATKMSIIVPFFAMLGYDVFNPSEFVPEFSADVGIKKGEKVDYAIVQNGEPIILIEAKWCGEKLEKHDSQLFRYFSTTPAKFAILTNGIIYKFYTDLDAPNKMDSTPFLEIDILNIKESQVGELKKFNKSNFNPEEVFSTASELKYENEFKNIFASELQNPSDNFTKFFLSRAYSGVKTQNIIDTFKPILQKSLNNYISELMNDKIKAAFNSDVSVGNISKTQESVDSAEPPAKDSELDSGDSKAKQIITTAEELEAYFIIKNMLKDVVPMSDITYRDTLSYFNILYKDNGRKWICRLILTDSRKILVFPTTEKGKEKFTLENIYDLEDYRDRFVEIVNRLKA